MAPPMPSEGIVAPMMGLHHGRFIVTSLSLHYRLYERTTAIPSIGLGRMTPNPTAAALGCQRLFYIFLYICFYYVEKKSYLCILKLQY
jgi:hypothetical protein